MGSINIIKPLSTFLPHASLINRRNVKIPNKKIGMAQNQTCGSRVKNKNASRVLCRPPHFWYFNCKKLATPRSDGKFCSPKTAGWCLSWMLWAMNIEAINESKGLIGANEMANLSTLVDCLHVEFGIVNAYLSGSLSPCHMHWLALLLVQSLSRQM